MDKKSRAQKCQYVSGSVFQLDWNYELQLAKII